MKNNKGITLIALIITIIVLLLLSGVAIITLTGENGIINRAEIATEKTIIKNAEEIIKLIIIENKIAENEENQSDYLENNQLIEKIISKLKSEGYNIEKDKDTVTYGKEQIKISDFLEKKEAHEVSIKAPKNSTIIINSNGKEIGNLEVKEDDESSNKVEVYRKLGETITAICKLKDEVIYEKTFKLEEINTINMYPCEENGDGKALYWYGMEIEDFEIGSVRYGGSSITTLGTCTNKDNILNLYFKDTSNTAPCGIGINYKQDLTNFNNIEIKVVNLTYTGFGVVQYLVGDVANDYSNPSWQKLVEDTISESGYKVSLGLKNLDISSISGEKYLSILNYNWAGSSVGYQYGSLSLDIQSIVLKK